MRVLIADDDAALRYGLSVQLERRGYAPPLAILDRTTGARIASLQQSLELRVTELQDALAMVKQLSRLLPICASCTRIRKNDAATGSSSRRTFPNIFRRSSATASVPIASSGPRRTSVCSLAPAIALR